MNRGIPEKSLLAVNHTVSNLALSADPGRVRHDVLMRMREHALHLIAESDKVEEQRGGYSTQFRISVYVLNPDDLHRIVQEEAMQLGLLRPVQCVPDVNVELLKALEAARALWGDYLPPGNSNAMKAMRMVDAAIAKAKAVKS